MDNHVVMKAWREVTYQLDFIENSKAGGFINLILKTDDIFRGDDL